LTFSEGLSSNQLVAAAFHVVLRAGLETKWASFMSYGLTSKLLQEVLPIDEPVNTFTLRQHVAEVAERLEQELGDERFCFIEGCQ
jgi:hypothetical protein